MAKKAETESFSITLPRRVIEMIDEGIVPSGLFGSSRASACSNLILDRLKQSDAREIVKENWKKSD